MEDRNKRVINNQKHLQGSDQSWEQLLFLLIQSSSCTKNLVHFISPSKKSQEQQWRSLVTTHEWGFASLLLWGTGLSPVPTKPCCQCPGSAGTKLNLFLGHFTLIQPSWPCGRVMAGAFPGWFWRKLLHPSTPDTWTSSYNSSATLTHFFRIFRVHITVEDAHGKGVDLDNI